MACKAWIIGVIPTIIEAHSTRYSHEHISAKVDSDLPVPPTSMHTVLCWKGYWILTFFSICLNLTAAPTSSLSNFGVNVPSEYIFIISSISPINAFVDTFSKSMPLPQYRTNRSIFRNQLQAYGLNIPGVYGRTTSSKLARMHAQVGRFKGSFSSGKPKVNTNVSMLTRVFFFSLHSTHSSVNWHFPGSTTIFKKKNICHKTFSTNPNYWHVPLRAQPTSTKLQSLILLTRSRGVSNDVVSSHLLFLHCRHVIGNARARRLFYRNLGEKEEIKWGFASLWEYRRKTAFGTGWSRYIKAARGAKEISSGLNEMTDSLYVCWGCRVIAWVEGSAAKGDWKNNDEQIVDQFV